MSVPPDLPQAAPPPGFPSREDSMKFRKQTLLKEKNQQPGPLGLGISRLAPPGHIFKALQAIPFPAREALRCSTQKASLYEATEQLDSRSCARTKHLK